MLQRGQSRSFGILYTWIARLPGAPSAPLWSALSAFWWRTPRAPCATVIRPVSCPDGAADDICRAGFPSHLRKL